MSEYQERHSVSRLIGAPPGYVGYDESGQLTEAIRRKPYAVVLLDEIEKAHPDVFNILLQVLDDGRLTDNKGRVVDFRNTIVIMTSNIGSHLIQENFAATPVDGNDDRFEKTQAELMALLKRSIRPEFLNRIDDIIVFKPLTEPEIKEITHLQFTLLKKMLAKQSIEISMTEEATNFIATAGFDPQFGARPVKRILRKTLINELSKMILSGEVKKESAIVIDSDGSKLLFSNTA
jgi:ATP-dependent Clp protease ATP-binding subunit ClpB